MAVVTDRDRQANIRYNSPNTLEVDVVASCAYPENAPILESIQGFAEPISTPIRRFFRSITSVALTGNMRCQNILTSAVK